MSSGPGPQQEYGKGELVELITGVRCENGLDWVEVAQNQPVNISPEDMREVFSAVMSFKQNRIRNYGPDGEYTRYYMPSFNEIEAAYRSDNFQAFKTACEGLLSAIAWD